MLHRELLLGWPELGIVLTWLETLGIERVEDVADDGTGAVHAIRAEAQTIVGRDESAAVDLAGEIELVLERGLDPQSMTSGAVNHVLEKCARAQLPGLTVERVHVAQQACFARRVRQHREGARIRDKSDLANWPQMTAGC